MTSGAFYKKGAYPKYRPSGLAWLGDVPDHWETRPLFALLGEMDDRNEGTQVKNVLSLSYGNIVDRDVESNFGLLPESFESYQIVEDGDIILRLTDLQNDQRSLRVGQVRKRGIITSAYVCLRGNGEVLSEFAAWLLKAYDMLKVFYALGSGVRQVMGYVDLKRLPIFLPGVEEQRAIAAFLDVTTARLDALIAQKQRLIELLKEKRQAFITQAVTKGLNSKAKLKDSGVTWLGQVPIGWEVKPLKYSTRIYRGKFSYRPRNDPKLYDGPFPFIQTGDVARAKKRIETYQQTLNVTVHGFLGGNGQQ